MSIDDNPQRPAPKVTLRPVEISIRVDDSEARATLEALKGELSFLLARIEMAREALRSLRAEVAEAPLVVQGLQPEGVQEPIRIGCRRCGQSFDPAEGHHCQAIGIQE